MELLNVIVAAAGSFAFGAIWYMAWAKPWMAASGVSCDENGNPENGASPLPYIMSAVSALVVAGMMRHMFAMSPVDSVWEGAVSGFGVGAFFIAPWIMMNNGFGGKPFTLTLIDGGYAAIGCGIIGTILMLF